MVNLAFGMDKNSISDRMNFHLAAIPRRVPSGLPIEALGHMPRKNDHLRRTFATVNFSCLLAGHGTYFWEGEHHRVEAPAVLTQWPGALMDYGPAGTWRELYLIYPAESEANFRSWGILRHDRPFWSLTTPGPFLDAVDDVLRCMVREPIEEEVDRLDRLAERVVLEAHLGASAPRRSPSEAIIVALRDAIDRGDPTLHDPEVEALRRGLSRTHFRRLWARIVGPPPARYLMERRLRQAARRLAEEDVTLATIAHDVGFDDPLYFSRRFKAAYGVSPGRYRERHRTALP